jgi:phosphatidylserine decarboxylase
MSKQLPISGRPRGRLPFAPEGWPFIIPAALLMFTAFIVYWYVVAIILLMLLVFMVNFFRDPERSVPAGSGLFVSPADGKVIRAEESDGCIRIDIFMNVFNVHVNRAPIAGRITHMQYFPGRFINASFDEASEENERNRFEVECKDGGKIAFTQIAGLLARRIVAYAEVGDQIEVGQRIGMIRFGSRVNCEISAAYQLNVQVGEKVRAGSTVLARRREPNAEA